MKLNLAILLSFLPLQVTCSPGDNLDEFWDCRDACEYQRRCPGFPIDWIDSEKNEFASHEFEDTPFVLSKFLFWSCIGDCDYQCQQIITKMRMEQGEEILQFHGKWPFLRLLTMQELFSAVFSMGNFIPHYRAFLKLRSKVARATPAERTNSRTRLLQNYMSVAIAGMAAWIASTIFHWRDLLITEKCDYFFAGMTVVSAFHAIFARITHIHQYKTLSTYFTGSVMFIFFLHILRLYIDWSYTYNMRFNVFFGILQYLLLICLAIQNYMHLKQKQRQRQKHPKANDSAYYKQSNLIFRLTILPILLVISTATAMSLELFDFFSYRFQIDAHALWHFCTIVPSWYLYDFFIDDYDLIAFEFGRGAALM